MLFKYPVNIIDLSLYFGFFAVVYFLMAAQEGFAVSDVRFFAIVCFQRCSRGLRRFGFI
jgi:hypothetical protein